MKRKSLKNIKKSKKFEKFIGQSERKCEFADRCKIGTGQWGFRGEKTLKSVKMAQIGSVKGREKGQNWLQKAYKWFNISLINCKLPH